MVNTFLTQAKLGLCRPRPTGGPQDWEGELNWANCVAGITYVLRDFLLKSLLSE